MKVIVIQNRMGIGDLIIFLPYIFFISKEYNTPVSLLVRESTKAKELLQNNPYVNEIITLDRNDKSKTGRHQGVVGIINLVQDLRKKNFTKSFTFNSSARYALITKLAGIKERYQYPLFEKNKQNIIETAKKFINVHLNKTVESNPILNIDQKKIIEAKNKYKFDKEYCHILLGLGGSGPTKRVPVEKFIQFMNLISSNKKCKFYLAAGKNPIEQEIINKVINSKHKANCISLGFMNILEILPIIKNCNLAVSNDTSFSHISAALGVKTIVLMTDTPLLYGSYSPRMIPVLPEGETNVTHDSLGKEKINPEEIYINAKKILNL
jgi:heptosyltransferase-2|tara:strand:+ start:58 stop:1026 length:969 start_codon:yes stop_codon:yes gene_type:complete